MRRIDKRTKKSNDPVVEAYLRSVGISEYQEQQVFWERLREKHGPIAEQVTQAIAAREEGEEVDVYPLKNATLALSIDVTFQYYNRLYQEFLDWFCRSQFSEPQSLLDVGCDNGMLTCFYASLYPRAEVVGIDKGEEGIRCARELANRLELVNARFEVCDLHTLGEIFPDRSFDLIVSTAVFHEVLDFQDHSWQVQWKADVASGPQHSRFLKIVKGLLRLLVEGGTFVSMERCPDAPTLAWWIRLLNGSGLRLAPGRSRLLVFHDAEGEQEVLPIVVARSHDTATPGGDDSIVAFSLYEEIDKNCPGATPSA